MMMMMRRMKMAIRMLSNNNNNSWPTNVAIRVGANPFPRTCIQLPSSFERIPDEIQGPFLLLPKPIRRDDVQGKTLKKRIAAMLAIVEKHKDYLLSLMVMKNGGGWMATWTTRSLALNG